MKLTSTLARMDYVVIDFLGGCLSAKVKLLQLRETSVISSFIIWQDSLEVNPSVLIGSFLVGILPYGLFPWKRSYGVYFLFSKAGKFKLRKEKGLNTHLRKKLPKKIDILQSLQYEKGTQIFTKRILLSWRSNTETYSGIGEHQDDFTKKQKSANTNKMATDLNTLLHSL